MFGEINLKQSIKLFLSLILIAFLVSCNNNNSENYSNDYQNSNLNTKGNLYSDNFPIYFIPRNFDFLYSDSKEFSPPINAITLHTISCETNGDQFFLFLPQWSKYKDLTIFFSNFQNNSIEINGQKYKHGDIIKNINNNQELLFLIDEQEIIVNVLFGSEIPTIFIFTESGNLNDIHASQNHREATTFLFVDEFGNIEHFGDGDMNGRGNWTWRQSKRPYNFRLSSGTRLPLFGLREGRHWTLLANYIDYELIRNQIALNLAREIGMKDTSHILPIDLFINNQYQGVYDLVERRNINHAVNINDLQAATAAVNIYDLRSFPRSGTMTHEPNSFKYFDIPHNPPDITGDYFLEMQLVRRYGNALSGFVTEIGTPVLLRSPEIATREQIEYISTFFQNLENAIYSSDGYNDNGVHFSEMLDIKSFAQMYILHEFTMDFDSARTSFFMVKKSSVSGSGKIYANAPWDFDNTFGAREDSSNYNELFANGRRNHQTGRGTDHILTALNRHEIFQEAVIYQWQNNFSPLIRVLIGYDTDFQTSNLQSISEYISDISESAQMNRIVWPNPITYSRDILLFSRGRYAFLESLWGN